MRIRERWRELREQDERENDERTHMVNLLALRDGFIAVMLLIFVPALALPFVGEGMLNAVAPYAVVFFPLVVLVVVGSVTGVSISLRGGSGWSSAVANYRLALGVIGGSVGLWLVIALTSFGPGTPLADSWASAARVLLFFVVTMAVLSFAFRPLSRFLSRLASRRRG